MATFSSVPLPEGLEQARPTVFVAPAVTVEKLGSVNVHESEPLRGVDSTVTVLPEMLPSTPVEMPSS